LVSVKNLQRVADDLGITVPAAELQEMITRADLDKDGFVNADEFYTILTRPIKE
jgi:Ca2+-binding EF-hand superfamily protein